VVWVRKKLRISSNPRNIGFLASNFHTTVGMVAPSDIMHFMQEEIVDIVDEKDNILGNTSKRNAHKKGLLHRTVIAEVIDSKGRFTLVKQAPDRQDAGQYVSPVGGHVRSGETEEEALKREALEEVGLKEFDFKYIGKAVFNRKVLGRKENHYFILFEIYTDDIPKLNHESVGYEQFTKAQLKRQIQDSPKKFGDAYYFILNKFYPNLLK
jgi:isopentenyl-diphosphate delta-isomerase